MNPRTTFLIALMMALTPLAGLSVQAQAEQGPALPADLHNVLLDGHLDVPAAAPAGDGFYVQWDDASFSEATEGQASAPQAPLLRVGEDGATLSGTIRVRDADGVYQPAGAGQVTVWLELDCGSFADVEQPITCGDFGLDGQKATMVADSAGSFKATFTPEKLAPLSWPLSDAGLVPVNVYARHADWGGGPSSHNAASQALFPADPGAADALEDTSFTPVLLSLPASPPVPVLGDGLIASIAFTEDGAPVRVVTQDTFTVHVAAHRYNVDAYQPYVGGLEVGFLVSDSKTDASPGWSEAKTYLATYDETDRVFRVDVATADLPRSLAGYQVVVRPVGGVGSSTHLAPKDAFLSASGAEPAQHQLAAADLMEAGPAATPLLVQEYLNPVDASGTVHPLVVHLPRDAAGNERYLFIDGQNRLGLTTGDETTYLDPADQGAVPETRIGGLGTIDYDRDPAFGTACAEDGCDNTIDEDSDKQPTILLIDLDQPVVVPGTQSVWDDRQGLVLDRIHVKRAGDQGTDWARYAQLHSDLDDDGHPDNRETGPVGSCATNPTNPAAHCDDWDGDGVDNGVEDATPGMDRSDPDSDGDGLTDGDEVNVHGSDPTTPHSDEDGITDDDEVNKHGTDPTKTDSDGDGFDDDVEIAQGSDPNSDASTPGDTDQDGLLDSWEQTHFGNLQQTGTGDPDGDGLPNEAEETGGTDPNNRDHDGDGLDDGVEDANQNGRVDKVKGAPTETDPKDSDSDDDGFSDGDEDAAGSDPLDPASTPGDSDADGLHDAWEQQYFGDLDETPDGDFDGDGLTNAEEQDLGTDPTKTDTDGDDLSDGREARDRDDPQGCRDGTPLVTSLDCDGGYGTEPADDGEGHPAADSDGDGLSDGDEVDKHGTDPTKPDSDGDGASDGEEVTAGSDPNDAGSKPGNVGDVDDDGLDDAWERQHFGSTLLQDGTGDPDSDGLDNEGEETTGTDPKNPDTDGDLLTDGQEDSGSWFNPATQVEKEHGHGPTDPTKADTDGDGIRDHDELLGQPCLAGSGVTGSAADAEVYHTAPPVFCDDPRIREPSDPTKADTDGDGLPDAEEANVHFTDPSDADTDGDGLNDGREVKDTDNPTTCTDADGADPCDGGYGTTPVQDPVSAVDATDTDGDGLGDLYEADSTYPTDCSIASGVCTVGFDCDADENLACDNPTDNPCDPANAACLVTDPTVADTDGDGLLDGEEVVGKWTAIKVTTRLTGSTSVVIGSTFEPTHPVLADTDGDGLGDGHEVKDRNEPGSCPPDTGRKCDDGYGTSPLDRDHDGDGLLDGAEADGVATNGNTYTSDPTKADTDGDGLPDWQEVLDKDTLACSTTCDGGFGTDPTKADTDGDTLHDVVELFQTFPQTCNVDAAGACQTIVSCETLAGSLCTQVKVTSGGVDGVDTLGPVCAAKGDNDACLPDVDACTGALCTDPHNKDTDGDGLMDGEEVRGAWAAGGASNANTRSGATFATNPVLPDTDGDGLSDGHEFKDRDDPQGCTGIRRATMCDGGHETDPRHSRTLGIPDAEAILDSDGDGLLDGEEVAGSWFVKGASPATSGTGFYRVEGTFPPTDPADPDTDDDGLPDGREVKDRDDPVGCTAPNQANNDPNTCDLGYGTEPADDGQGHPATDSDGDGLSDGDEVAHTAPERRATCHAQMMCDPAAHPDPATADTDEDGLDDGHEVKDTDNPTRCTDADGADPCDGGHRTDPTMADTDGDGFDDGDEVDNRLGNEELGTVPASSDPNDATDSPATANAKAAALLLARSLRIPDPLSALNLDGSACDVLNPAGWSVSQPSISEDGLLSGSLWDAEACNDRDGGQSMEELVALAEEIQQRLESQPRPEDLPGTLPDREDPHDTDADGNVFESNGQPDEVEKNWFYLDFDEDLDEGDEPGRLEGDGAGFTAHLLEHGVGVYTVRVGDVAGTEASEALVVERTDAGGTVAVCVYDDGTPPHVSSAPFGSTANACGGPAGDADDDGVNDVHDACPGHDDTADSDGDGTADGCDAFPADPGEQVDTDGDGTGDNADAFPDDPEETTDSDGDGVGDNADAFPNNPAEWADADGDGVGDNADAFDNDPNEWADSDGDGVSDSSDACPGHDDTADADGDGLADGCDTDRDGDGVPDGDDAFPDDGTESVDTDGDGVGDNSDAFPTDPAESADSDGDGVGDNSDACPDGDDTADGDGDGTPDHCDDNRDGDLLPNQAEDPTGDGSNHVGDPDDPTSPTETGGAGVDEDEDGVPAPVDPDDDNPYSPYAWERPCSEVDESEEIYVCDIWDGWHRISHPSGTLETDLISIIVSVYSIV